MQAGKWEFQETESSNHSASASYSAIGNLITFLEEPDSQLLQSNGSLFSPAYTNAACIVADVNASSAITAYLVNYSTYVANLNLRWSFLVKSTVKRI